jgi:hypothetical protein
MRVRTWVGVGIVVFAAAGCGGGGGGAKGGSYSDISSSFAHPTGTLAPTNADVVAKAYETSLTSGLAAGRRAVQASTVNESVACPNGGTITVSATTSGSSSSPDVNETFNYNACCETAGCCLTGGGNLYYAQSGSFCESFSVTGTCEAEPVTVSYSICEDISTGTLSYLVDVQGETFAVSGSYSAGSGTLTIVGSNGTFTCTYTNDTGSCTGTSGTFSF